MAGERNTRRATAARDPRTRQVRRPRG